jgi:methylenetetrahydrofolate dehydrogenase (NADP+) / methenyltetrahydrofolate cyclohydrolase
MADNRGIRDNPYPVTLPAQEHAMQLLDGKALSQQIKAELKEEVMQRIDAGLKVPHLAAVLVGDDGASQTYVASKVKSCEQIGYGSTLVRRDASTSEAELLDIVHGLNEDPDVDGFIVQLPLPRHINVDRIIEAIDPRKDVDGFHPVNVGRMVQGLPAFISATPLGIITMLERYGIKTSGLHCVVVGRSNIVGRPMSILMSRSEEPGNATVTLCHSRTRNLSEEVRRADIVIAALGKPEFVTADMVKDGAIVIDVGITRVEDASIPRGYVLKGDVKFDEVAPKCSYITPVPGGVGAMTVTALLMNTMKAVKGVY